MFHQTIHIFCKKARKFLILHQMYDKTALNCEQFIRRVTFLVKGHGNSKYFIRRVTKAGRHHVGWWATRHDTTTRLENIALPRTEMAPRGTSASNTTRHTDNIQAKAGALPVVILACPTHFGRIFCSSSQKYSLATRSSRSRSNSLEQIYRWQTQKVHVEQARPPHIYEFVHTTSQLVRSLIFKIAMKFPMHLFKFL